MSVDRKQKQTESENTPMAITKQQCIDFYKIITIERPTRDITIATVKPNSEMALIRLGCFNGNEKMFRMTKSGWETDYTVWSGDENKAFNWSSATLVSDRVRMMAEYIQTIAR